MLSLHILRQLVVGKALCVGSADGLYCCLQQPNANARLHNTKVACPGGGGQVSAFLLVNTHIRIHKPASAFTYGVPQPCSAAPGATLQLQQLAFAHPFCCTHAGQLQRQAPSEVFLHLRSRMNRTHAVLCEVLVVAYTQHNSKLERPATGCLIDAAATAWFIVPF